MAIILQLLCGEEDMVWNCFFQSELIVEDIVW